MGWIANKTIPGTLAYYVGVVLGYVNILLLSPLMDPEALGLNRMILNIAVMISQFTQLGLSHTIIKFFPGIVKHPHYSRFLFYALAIPMGIFLIISLLYTGLDFLWLHWFTDASPLLANYSVWVLPLALGMVYFDLFESLSRSLLKITIPVVLKEVGIRILNMIFIILFVQGKISLGFFLASLSLVYGIMLIILMIYVWQQHQGTFSLSMGALRPSYLKMMWVYSGWMMLNHGIWQTVNYIDTLMIGAMKGLEEVAVYTVGFYIATVIQVPQRILSKVLAPLVARHWERRNLTAIEELYQSSSKIQMAAGSLLLTLLMVNLESLFVFIPQSEIYRASATVIVWIAVSKWIDMAMGINTEILSVSSYYRFHFYAIVLLLISTVVTNAILIPDYGISGAAFATALSVTIFQISKVWFVSRYLRVQPFSWSSLWIIISTLLIGSVGYFVPISGSVWFQVISRTLWVGLAFGFVFLRLGILKGVMHWMQRR